MITGHDVSFRGSYVNPQKNLGPFGRFLLGISVDIAKIFLREHLVLT
jgi:hypothetical protein